MARQEILIGNFPNLNSGESLRAGVQKINENFIELYESPPVGEVADDSIINAKLANMPTQTIKGRTTAGTGDPEDLTVSQVKTMLGLTGTNSGDQTIALTGDVTGSGTGTFAATIAGNAVSNSKLADMATQTFKGRTTAGTGDPEDLTVAQVKTMLSLTGTNSGDQTISLTGDVTGSGAGSFAATIASNAVSNAKLADMATKTIKGRTTAATGDPEDLTPAQVNTMLSESTRTINISAGATAAEIQAVIDGLHKHIPNTATVTIKFANGTYTPTSGLVIQGFYGGGILRFDGDTTETTSVHNTQGVHIDGSSLAANVISCSFNTCRVMFRFLKVTAQDGYTPYSLSTNGPTWIQYGYTLLTGKTSTSSRHYISYGQGVLTLTNNQINNGYYAVNAQGATFITSDNTVVTGTSPTVGLLATTFGCIYKLNTQPTFTGAAESSSSGGSIV